MSISIFTFVKDLPRSFLDWQEAADACGLPLKFDQSRDLNARPQGFLPMIFGDTETGVETYFESASDFPLLAEKLSDRKELISFRWSTSAEGERCALAASAALIHSFDGRCYDPMIMQFLSYEECLLRIEGKANAIDNSLKMEKITYIPAPNKDGLFDCCQRCRWTFPELRTTMLCLECEARCPTCDSYSKDCVNPGIFQLGMAPKYWQWVRDQHANTDDNFWWFENFQPKTG